MKSLSILILIFFNTTCFAQNIEKAYFGGGCFWCMEESFDKHEGVIEVISGYSGGNKSNPTYKEVTFGNTGHFETVEVVYDTTQINFVGLLNIFWKNIDPFDSAGQFCDKGYSYRSVVFFQKEEQKKLIMLNIEEIEKKFRKKVVTYVRKFDKFFLAEEKHQNYYQKNFINYLIYKKRCGRELQLEKIWKQ